MSAAQATSAVSSGATAIVTSTLATVVSVSASMKAVYITHQHSPDTHSARPPLRSACQSSAGPRSQDNSSTSARALKPLRQKVTSKLRAASRWRVTTPAMLHISVASTISQTARRWLTGSASSRNAWPCNVPAPASGSGWCPAGE